MSVNRTSLGKRISFYRSKSNLTQEALAAKVNCSREYIVQIENGTKVPSLSVLVEIANTLSVSADELLLDCLEHSSSSANSEFHRLLLDCNETEQTVIIRMRQKVRCKGLSCQYITTMALICQNTCKCTGIPLHTSQLRLTAICTIINNSTFLRRSILRHSAALYLLLFELCHSAPARSCPIFQRRFL